MYLAWMSYSFSRQKQSSTSSVFDHASVIYILTIGKSEELIRAGHQVVELWEYDYDKRYKEDPDFRSLVDVEFTNLDPWRPRDALFGGRTNSTKLYQEIDESASEEIKYIDVCSLYPYVCKYGLFQLGHPTIYQRPFFLPCTFISHQNK